MKKKKIIICVSVGIAIIAIIIAIFLSNKNNGVNKSKELLENYIAKINEKKYEELYDSISNASKETISYEDFVKRNKNIYEGIELESSEITINEIKKENGKYQIDYNQILYLPSEKIEFSNSALIVKEGREYKLEWVSNLIFPNLNNSDKVSVSTIVSKRGEIYDRNGKLLAGLGKIYSIGLVPGKMNENAEEDIKKVAELLEMKEETVKTLLKASYVTDDTFVELYKTPLSNTELIDKVLEIKGVKVIQKEERIYPYGEATSHLIGYVQGINAEELSEHQGEGYHVNSRIGKVGLERVYEEKLRGIDGIEIKIMNEDGTLKETLLKNNAKDGENIKTTIDAEKQSSLYEQFKSQNGFFIVMNPKTGEVYSLISTPGFDSNEFSLGISSNNWNALNNDERKPLYNRYTASWCPGSTFKPITAAIGLNTQKIDPNEDFGHSGYRYQKDESWGDYQITTLQEYFSPAILQNALKYSDNIYFAKAGMKIGAETFANELLKLGFDQSMEFEQLLAKSTFSNTNQFETEIKLADSSYGQGEVLVNPLHMASIYSSFVNEGSMIKPYIIEKEDKTVTYVKENVFSKETANLMKEYLIQVVEEYDATAHGLKTDGITIGAKTGTAELKKDKNSEGMELSWLIAFTADESQEKQYLVISMREDNKIESFSLFPLVKSVFE